MNRVAKRLLVAAIMLLLLIVLAGPNQAQPRLRVLSLAMPTTPPNLVHIPPWVALETGIFARYGIEPKIFTFEGGPSALRALIGSRGELQVAAPGVPPFISAIAAGTELKAIGTYAMQHPVAMVVQGDIKRCEDLRGKKIGTPGGTGAYSEVMTRGVLFSCGLTPRDVQYINIATAARVPALVNNQIDAIVLHVDQVFEAVEAKKTLRILTHMSETLPRGWYAAYVTTGDVMRNDPKLLQDAMSALLEANRFIYQNRDKTIEIGIKYTKFEKDTVSRTYDELSKRGIWPVNEGLRKDLVEAGLDTEVRIGTITAAVKPTYEQAVQIGFVRAALTKLGMWTGDARWH